MINRKNHSDFDGHCTHWYRYMIRTGRCMHFVDGNKNTKNWIVSHNQLNRLDIPQLQEENSPIQFVMKLKFKAYELTTAISILITNDGNMKNRGHTFYRVPVQKSTFSMDCSEKLHTKIPNFNLHTNEEKKLNFKHYKIPCW